MKFLTFIFAIFAIFAISSVLAAPKKVRITKIASTVFQYISIKQLTIVQNIIIRFTLIEFILFA